jgi:hypothetical protein
MHHQNAPSKYALKTAAFFSFTPRCGEWYSLILWADRVTAPRWSAYRKVARQSQPVQVLLF